ncbi:MAG: RNA-binding S4 domain-containing protein [Bacilli bacterium]|jgi:ribosomal 50S subunit-recycling heat shock protein|nr:RNA-binding S4 domain-containing protein [Bacilli bacterium]
MRIDKYLQVTRIIKRRVNAKEMLVQGRVLINDKVAKPGTNVNIGDYIKLRFGNATLTIKVLDIRDKIKKEEVEELFEIIQKESI